MSYLIALLLVIGLFSQLPQWWAQYLLHKHHRPLDKLPGGGGAFAYWLAQQHLSEPIAIEPCDCADHYDPLTRTVRLSKTHYDTPSLTALAVAAHEMAHAQQHQQQDPAFMERIQLIQRAQWLQKFSAGALIATPLLIPLLHTPMIGLLTFTAGFIAQGVPVLIHLSTLKVEWDASFNRALPWLEETGRFTPAEMRIIKRILTACALTYVAQSLGSLFNLWRWLSPHKR